MTTQQKVTHTPGPWENVGIFNKMTNSIHVNLPTGSIQVSTDNGYADAHLIAASPELLSYLKDAAFQLARLSGEDLEIYARTFSVLAKNAIDKAEGRAQ